METPGPAGQGRICPKMVDNGWPNEVLGVFRLDAVFNGHVFEFTGIKDVATLLALDEFCIFFASHNAYAGMPTDLLHIRYFRGTFRGW